jgi:hypothetical protein
MPIHVDVGKPDEISEGIKGELKGELKGPGSINLKNAE